MSGRDESWRAELHAQLDAAIDTLEGVHAIVLLVEYEVPVPSGWRRDLVVRASFGERAVLGPRAIEAVRKMTP